MPAVMEAIDRMTTSEKFDAMSYLWSSLSKSGDSLVPDWHRRELAKTEARVAAGIERPIPLNEVLSPEWEAEIARRVDEVRSGSVNPIPFDDSLRRAYERIASIHSTKAALAQ